jgi:uncharacterized membrane protein
LFWEDVRVTKYIIAYIACALVFFPIDYVWLSRMGAAFYRPQLGNLLLENPNLAVAGLFYLAYFAIHPANSLTHAMVLGAALGFIAYGTYDLTNLSTVKGFTPAVAIVDMAWGTALTAISAGAGYWAMNQFG